ncbi:hypothetical protein [Peribacillus glennii]|uniref:DUF4340 domain-containing protein n=1 Tax=Peribacillus glennii TaxID=2303991 RepID=A0A372L6T5_9BACI|nr:hypothetical protein [Peribacillus glennii]RFU60800.1 hypothetical protein D0466_20845 [Peribacillus glennii]
MNKKYLLALVILAAILCVSITQMINKSAVKEVSSNENLHNEKNIEEKKIQKEQKPASIPIEKYNPRNLKEDEIGIYQTDDTVKIVTAPLVKNDLLNASIQLPGEFEFYDKETDFEKFERSRENEINYGYSINYNDYDRYFIATESRSYGVEVVGEVVYLANGETNISIQDVTKSSMAASIRETDEMNPPGPRAVDDGRPKNDGYVSELMMKLGEGKAERIDRSLYIHPVLKKMSVLAKVTNQKNGHTFYAGLLKNGQKIYNISIRRHSLNVGVDDLANEWAILDTLLPLDMQAEEGTPDNSNTDSNDVIKNIQAEYNQINSPSSSFIKEVKANKTFFYNDNKSLQKVVEKLNSHTYEYYFTKNGELFFVYWIDPSKNENRFYFHEGKMIRWIQPDKTVIDQKEGISNAEFRDFEFQWLVEARQY